MYIIHRAGGVIHNRPLMHPPPRTTVGQVFPTCPFRLSSRIYLNQAVESQIRRNDPNSFPPADACHFSADRCQWTAVKELNARS
jgi:hypothetical protein